ncbi:hypothetical protein Tdes44962_MAKER02375 [Teratosphaeria destructans]|uniref:Oxidase ustYa n=1 Tax=Teratosphaeria destructans TaxID=418781 RepID=A0A9W7W323_9PEZI|nr:hypothetical protein Tdes44962_MAKER02375 [Teratosphaeria destructans]
MPTLKELPVWLGGQSRQGYTSVTHDERENDQAVQRDLGQTDEAHQQLLDTIRRLKRWRTALCCLLILAIAAASLSLDSTYRAFHRHPDLPRSPVPLMPKTLTTFIRNDSFASAPTPENDTAWSSISPPGDGFVLFPNRTRDAYGLPLGKPAPQGDVYDISLFHQLHCLVSMREHLLMLQASIGRENQAQVMEVLIRPQEQHVWHCFDYLRQAVMCAGDMTVEWPRTEEDGSRFAVDGWGITHQCADWVSRFAFVVVTRVCAVLTL